MNAPAPGICGGGGLSPCCRSAGGSGDVAAARTRRVHGRAADAVRSMPVARTKDRRGTRVRHAGCPVRCGTSPLRAGHAQPLGLQCGHRGDPHTARQGTQGPHVLRAIRMRDDAQPMDRIPGTRPRSVEQGRRDDAEAHDRPGGSLHPSEEGRGQQRGALCSARPSADFYRGIYWTPVRTCPLSSSSRDMPTCRRRSVTIDAVRRQGARLRSYCTCRLRWTDANHGGAAERPPGRAP